MSTELGILVGGLWRQWESSTGEDYYEEVATGKTQSNVPTGHEDAAADTWTLDTSKSLRQWRNNRTGRIRRTSPNPAPPRTSYLAPNNIQANLRTVVRVPESHEYRYRRVMMSILKYFFKEADGFDVFQEESRGELSQAEPRADMTVLMILNRPGGSFYAYDFCLVESKKANGNWNDTKIQLSRHCGGTKNESGQVYGIVHIGLYVQFFKAQAGVLTALSNPLHLQNDVNTVTNWFNFMKSSPLPVL
ncbi:hypothetical protein K432DRAFT_444463 [Lepidopterella palustris CBS 459.81]|uniref:Uncharacterized protein n=1 Tax=Lepidopterella palustris CBS 459.81 TaxID=1314670 RepID=A0A8E2E797_9PEZI|nr:hypothetical protein K432DRAFT_444463 [Lepidopterella palustris CBS 459.81]